VQSRVREMERLQPQELKKSNIQRPYIRFVPAEKAPGQVILKGSALSKAYDDLPVISNFSIELLRGQKVGIIGPNGCGKTTLVKMLSGLLAPDQGSVETGHNVLPSYFPQNHAELIDKKESINAFDWLKKHHSSTYDQEIRSALGKMLFGGDDAFKPVGTLSGGETARLLLASMMLASHNLLILDEPNNHLDLEAVSALAWGLAEYKGSLLLVSHDRDLIGQAATVILAYEKGAFVLFDGSLEEYLAAKPKK
jgi:ATPase subunit of ABC transporter with duplicated ATPase domains